MSMVRCVALAADHGGFSLKQELIHALQAEKWHALEGKEQSAGKQSVLKVVDLGVHTEDSVHYPVVVRPLVELILREKKEEESRPQKSVIQLFPAKKTPDVFGQKENKTQDYPATCGVLICGSGLGVSMAANRFLGIRAALCTSKKMAFLARRHNNANILVLGGRLISFPKAFLFLKTFLSTAFEGGRHAERVALLDKMGH